MRFTYQTGAQPLAGYTIQRGIHRGGFGEVYFAHSDGGKEVALKLLHHQDQDIEIRGVTQCLNLKHPNLVNLFDVKTDRQGDHWVVMEYVAGSNLEDVLASFPDGLPLGEVQEWLSGLVAGVSHLHDRGIVHRDLKPANVYRENGVVKVGDVGLSKRLDSDHRRQHTQSVGTVYYMAPEVAKGQYGPEVDVYALGIMVYEMITGKLPFNGETTAEILMKHLTAQPDLTPIPKELRPTLARVLEKDPSKRTATVRDLEREFLQATAQSSRPIPSAVADPDQRPAHPQFTGAFAEPQGAFSDPYTIPESSFLPPVPPYSNDVSPKEAPWRRQHAEHERSRHNPAPARASRSRNDDAPFLQPRHWLYLSLMLGMILLLTGSIKGPVPIGHARIPSAVGFVILAFLIIPTAGFAVLHSIKTFLNRIVFADDHRTDPSRQTSGSYTGSTPPRHEFHSEAMNPRHARRAAAAVAAEHRTRFYDRPWSERLPELANSLGYAALVASLLSAGVYVVLEIPMRAGQPNPFLHTPETAVLFVAISIVGAWSMLIGHAATSGSAWTNHQRWLARVATGMVLGSIVYAMDEFLIVNYPPAAFNAKSIFKRVGKYPLVEMAQNGHSLTWLAYVLFFAGWMGLRRWSREMDLHRKELFRIGTVVSAVVVAFLMAWVFRFPQVYAMLWAGTISTTVQLASPWSAPQSSWERRSA